VVTDTLIVEGEGKTKGLRKSSERRRTDQDSRPAGGRFLQKKTSIREKPEGGKRLIGRGILYKEEKKKKTPGKGRRCRETSGKRERPPVGRTLAGRTKIPPPSGSKGRIEPEKGRGSFKLRLPEEKGKLRGGQLRVRGTRTLCLRLGKDGYPWELWSTRWETN